MLNSKIIITAISACFVLFVLVRCASVQETGTLEEVSDDIVSYQKDVAPIVNNYCVSCHGGSAPSAGFALTSYEEVRNKVEFGSLLKRINDHSNPMPQSGLLPKTMRETISKWAKQGFAKGNSIKVDSVQLNYEPTPPAEITPIDINKKGFDLLENMQGHWVGKMKIMADNYNWFAFDYRAIDSSHIHGIFEGGTMGNLFTSFFVTNFKGKRTIMARNGGILNGIYRTSFFVLDSVRYKSGESYYRLVDAYGGKNIMWMELKFSGDQLEFNSSTSTFGTYPKPRKHMRFNAKRMHMELAEKAAKDVGFPSNVIDMDFSEGLPDVDWGPENPQTSASYIKVDPNKSLEELAVLAKDPYPLSVMPHVAKLKVEIDLNEEIKEQALFVYLSKDPLTNSEGKFITEYGYIKKSLQDGILYFPELVAGQSEFTFTYLHPGTYYLTVIADMDGNHYPSPGDISHSSIKVELKPSGNQEIKVENITTKN